MVFLGDIAFYMAALVFASGIYMIHHANHHDSGEKCKLLKSGGYIVTTIAVLGFLCTGYYWMKYYIDGAYERPSVKLGYRHGPMGNMKSGSMMGGSGPMMQNMNHCMGKMQGTMMGPEAMKNMRSCMQGSISKDK